MAGRVYWDRRMTIYLLALFLASLTVLAVVRWRPAAIDSFPSGSRRALALALLTSTLALACFAPLLQYPETDPNMEIADLPFGALFLGHGLLVTFLLLWWILAGRPPLRQYLHLTFTDLRDALQLGAAAGAAGWAVTMTTMAVVGTLAVALEPGSLPEDGEIPSAVRIIVELAWYERLLLVLSAGIVEEAFFRSFLQTRFGLILSSVLFTASHMSYGLPLMLVGVFAVSVVFGLVFRARRDVLPCMVAHSVFDGIQLFLILPAVVAGS